MFWNESFRKIAWKNNELFFSEIPTRKSRSERSPEKRIHVRRFWCIDIAEKRRHRDSEARRRRHSDSSECQGTDPSQDFQEWRAAIPEWAGTYFNFTRDQIQFQDFSAGIIS